MKIQDWEKRLAKHYPFEKITVFNKLKQFLTYEKSYAYNFCLSEVSEGYLLDEDFYAAYVFDERIISKRDVITHRNTGWTTTIVIITIDKNENANDYHILGLNCFDENNEDMLKAFLQVIDPKCK